MQDEKNISTAQYAEEENTRFPCTYEDKKRQTCHQSQTCQGQKKISRLKAYEILKRAEEYSYFYHQSKKAFTSSAIIFYKPTTQKRVGFTASKKVGNAVKRNFAKRRLKALFIDLQEHLKPGTYLFVAKKEIIDSDYQKLKKEFITAFKRLKAYRS
ncbi:MAG: ribonuclease P protein component [Campylobacteraceae bacterium 4484_4]|nr:MAG: ribonuclease P protein component [Campylobacteraceae bacterium 4484_4]